jgi:SAM-dependent methyltransferase
VKFNGHQKVDVNRPCIICGSSDDPKIAFSARYKEFGYPGKFLMRRCEGCGLLFNSPRLSEDDIAALYDKNYYVFAERPSAAFQRIGRLYKVSVGVMLPYLQGQRSQVLEIGSAKGYMLALLRELGYPTRGIELSTAAANSSRRVFGIDVFAGTLEAFVAQRPKDRYQFVYATDVIEHVPDLRGFARALSQVVVNNGYLLLSTPNAESQGLTHRGINWEGFNPFHIWCFTKTNLACLLESVGFTVLDAYSYNNLPLPGADASSDLSKAIRGSLPVPAANLLGRIKRTAELLLRPEPGTPNDLMLEMARNLRHGQSFWDSDDGKSELARACKGENLVIIARRASHSLAEMAEIA